MVFLVEVHLCVNFKKSLTNILGLILHFCAKIRSAGPALVRFMPELQCSIPLVDSGKWFPKLHCTLSAWEGGENKEWVHAILGLATLMILV